MNRYVYVIGGEGGPLKIGMSANPEIRLKDIRFKGASPLRVLGSFHCQVGDARLVEKVAHKLLNEKRANGEWFEVSPEEAAAAIQEAIAQVESGEFASHMPQRPKRTDTRGHWTFKHADLGPEFFALVRKAAQLKGMTMGDFVFETLREAAMAVIMNGEDESATSSRLKDAADALAAQLAKHMECLAEEQREVLISMLTERLAKMRRP